MDELYTFLRDNYIEDDNGEFRFDYSKEIIKWAIQKPGFINDWCLGVRSAKNQKILAFIAGAPSKITIYAKTTIKAAIMSFLCVHKKLRSKKLTPVLIKEMRRRIQGAGYQHAVYQGGDLVPTPFTKALYFHRSLNIKKLVDIGFLQLPKNMPLARYVKQYKPPNLGQCDLIGNPRLMEKKDIQGVYDLFKKDQKKFKVHFKLSQEELAHLLMPIKGNLWTIVFVDNDKNQITDFVTFYRTASTILKSVSQNFESHKGQHNHTDLQIATVLLHSCNTNNLGEVLKYVCHYSKNEIQDRPFDVLNIIATRDLEVVAREVKLGQGDGVLNQYLFNYEF